MEHIKCKNIMNYIMNCESNWTISDYRNFIKASAKKLVAPIKEEDWCIYVIKNNVYQNDDYLCTEEEWAKKSPIIKKSIICPKSSFIKYIRKDAIKMFIDMIINGAYHCNYTNFNWVNREKQAIIKLYGLDDRIFAIMILIMFDTSKLQNIYKKIQKPYEDKYKTNFQELTMPIEFNSEWKGIISKYTNEAKVNLEKKLKILL